MSEEEHFPSSTLTNSVDTPETAYSLIGDKLFSQSNEGLEFAKLNFELVSRISELKEKAITLQFEAELSTGTNHQTSPSDELKSVNSKIAQISAIKRLLLEREKVARKHHEQEFIKSRRASRRRNA